MEVISSLQNERIKNLGKLLDKKYRDIEGKFLVEGEHLVEEAFKAGLLLEVVKCEDYLGEYDVPTTLVTYDVIKKLSNTVNPQRIIGVVKKIEEKELGNKVLILDDIQDPGNLGTIIRSSLAFNIDSIVLSKTSVDMYNDKVIRSSEGMIFHINIIRRDILSLIEELHGNGYKVYGTKVDGGTSVDKISISNKYALVMGNEGNGVKDSILNLCDDYIYIDMNSSVESLNVGVATSIILYEFNKRG
ncbi:MAG: RNA methyltransferase [Bacilli bacterium]|nr:RNA methyltransferase [Bacilli bacterium]